jgi:hypothetical protein
MNCLLINSGSLSDKNMDLVRFFNDLGKVKWKNEKVVKWN